MTRKQRPVARPWIPSCFRFFVACLFATALTLGAAPVRADDANPVEKPKAKAPKDEKSKAKQEPKKDEPKAKEDAKKPKDEPAKEPEKAKPPVADGNSLPTVKDAAWGKTSPQSLQDLQDIESRVQAIASRAEKWTVGLIVGQARGSGVIISKEGYILTAGHVSATPDRPVQVILWDGKVVRGRSLGRNTGIDSGLIKIDEGEEWDHADMGDSSQVKQGDWCIAMGHPGGWQRGRPAVVRLGRVVITNDRVIGTDATLVGGDSGGPLFDMDGKVIAIHSRIAAPTTANFHVPIDTYRSTWDRLASKEDWTDRQVNLGAVAAINAENHAKGARVTAVTDGGPADQAGIQVGDIIRRFDNSRIRHCEDLVEALNRKKPTDTVAVDIQREGKNLRVTLVLAAGFAKAGPFLGISGQDHAKGVSIESVVPGTPAEGAKLEKGDVVTEFKGQKVADLSELQEIIRNMKAGESAELMVLRGGEEKKLSITLGMKG